MTISRLLPSVSSWCKPELTSLPSTIDGLTPMARSFVIARLILEQPDRMIFVVSPTRQAATELMERLQSWLGSDIAALLLPSDVHLLQDDQEAARAIGPVGARVLALQQLVSATPPRLVVTYGQALQTRLPPPNILTSRVLVLRVGQTMAPDTIAARLNAYGYIREEQVLVPGTYARRGDLLDVFPSDSEKPYRIDFFGDDIENIRTFDIESQRSDGRAESITLVPGRVVAYSRAVMETAAAELESSLRNRLDTLTELGVDDDVKDRLRDAVEAETIKIRSAQYFAGMERHVQLLHPVSVTVDSYLPEGTLVVFDEPATTWNTTNRETDTLITHLGFRADRGEILPVSDSLLVSLDTVFSNLSRFPHLTTCQMLRDVPGLERGPVITGHSDPVEAFRGRSQPFIDAVGTWCRNGITVIAISAQAPRIRGILQHNNLPEAEEPTPGKICLINGVINGGFRIQDPATIVLSDLEIFHPADVRKKNKARPEFKDGMRLTSLLDLEPGDYVVHINHGIGRYRGLSKIPVQGTEREFLLVQYDGNDKLYVPTDQIDRLQKYIGSEGNAPSVHKLGGTEWLKATAKAQRQAKEIAGDLVKLYAARQASERPIYSDENPWLREMEDAFPYVETDDQLRAVEDIIQDLQAPKPMDRLICGDVGFGKTEVAMRAAFKVATEGRQVAVLCPTTVLAAQHFQTFTRRLGSFPICIDMVSRFRSTKEVNRTIEAAKLGTADIVIGTHRLLSKDVSFKNLGLVIVDEEQRFGVIHKERLKQLRNQVDVITLSATPIPRTLHMALTGIRDMSVINQPPEGRIPVKTYVKSHDDGLIKEAIMREVDRGGQVYYLHNRVNSIDQVAFHLSRNVVPGIRVRVAHGQMTEDALEDVMVDFYNKEFDVLVCTTIVESGLDIPNVNTIIVDNADRFGLAQLYQLRGRVGRSRQQAYAYLLTPRSKAVRDVAEQRLDALREFSDLGSGYKIALRDLELRGAGNLLGSEQHGMVAAVGFDLYCQLLENAIHEAKGEPVEELTFNMPGVDLPVVATIPEKYIKAEPQRILMYKKLAACRTRLDVAHVQEEFEDRYGDPPPPVWNALALLRLRMRCAECGITSIGTEGRIINILLDKEQPLPPWTLRPLNAAYRSKHVTFENVRVQVPVDSAKILPNVEEMIEVIVNARNQPAPVRTEARRPPVRRL